MTVLSRRQFVGGAAAVAGAAVLPAVTAAAPAMATPAIVFPLATPDWVPLDPKAIARHAYEIVSGKHPGQEH